MSFRAGKHGHEMWPDCLRLGIAAITYNPLFETDLSKYPKKEPKELWAQLSPTQSASLHRVAYEMKADDIIYVKQGRKIVNKGIVKGSYYFDYKKRLEGPDGEPWSHQVPVEWMTDFPEVDILLGRSQQLTVEKLITNDLYSLEFSIKSTVKVNQNKEAIEGEIYKAEANFRSRNRALIQAKKANSDFRCEACGFCFEEVYGNIAQEYIIAHHLRPISSGVAKTTLDDIALLCANCHAVIHLNDPPLKLEELRKLIGR